MDKTEKLTLRECLLGDRAFYRHVLLGVLHIIVQNTLTNVVSLLDNVMVGQVGTLLLVSHDLAVIRMLADRTVVMLDGKIIESGLTDQILEDPQHAYTQQLVHSLL